MIFSSNCHQERCDTFPLIHGFQRLYVTKTRTLQHSCQALTKTKTSHFYRADVKISPDLQVIAIPALNRVNLFDICELLICSQVKTALK